MARRIELGARSFAEINFLPAPPRDSAYFYAGILNYVFGHVWHRPGLSRRDRRLITVACVGMCECDGSDLVARHLSSELWRSDLRGDGGADPAVP